MRLGVNTLFMVPGDVGGTEIFLRRTLQSIALTQPDIELVLFTTIDNNEVLQEDLKAHKKVEFHKLNFKASCRPARIIAEQTVLPFRVKQAGVDVLWSPGYTAPRFCSCPQVVTIPDLQYKTHPEDLSWLELKVIDRLVKSACRYCNAIITISEFSKKEVVRFGFAPREKVFPVHLGVESSFGEPVELDKEVQQQLGLNGKPYLLCVAHTYPHKKVQLLVEAYAKVQEQVPYDLVLVGKERRGEAEVCTQLAQVMDQDRVHRFQGLSFSSIIYLFQNAEVFVLPSSYEGFGLPVLEAMMAKTPVITTKEASIPEIGGEDVIYLDDLSSDSLAESIRDLSIMSLDVKKDLVKRAHERAAIFTWEKCAQGTVDVAQRVCLA